MADTSEERTLLVNLATQTWIQSLDPYAIFKLLTIQPEYLGINMKINHLYTVGDLVSNGICNVPNDDLGLCVFFSPPKTCVVA